MNRNTIFILAFSILAIGYLVVKHLNKNLNANIKTICAQRRNIEEKIIVSGIIEPQKEIDIKSTISGVLEHLYVNIGDYVEYGKPLARVQYVKDPMEYRRLASELEIAKSRFENIRQKYERSLILYKNGYLSKEDFEELQSNYDVLYSQYQTANTEFEMLKGNYANNQVSNIITATNNGTILDLPVKEGGSVMARGTYSEGSTLARLADLSRLVFKGDVSETDVTKLKQGMKVKCNIIAQDGIEFDGILTLIAPKGVLRDGVSYFEVVAAVIIPDSSRNLVRAGCTSNMEIVTNSRKNCIALDEKYFKFSYDTVYVEVISEDGLLSHRILQTGISDGIYTEIINGLDTVDKLKVEN